jgi:hypothetical protein
VISQGKTLLACSAAEASTLTMRAAACAVATVAAYSCPLPIPRSDVYSASPLACRR